MLSEVILKTELIFAYSKLEQLVNALLPSSVKAAGNTIFYNLVQFLNTDDPIADTLAGTGMVISFRPLHWLKASSSIVVIVFGNDISVK